jgi:hypothetical protein
METHGNTGMVLQGSIQRFSLGPVLHFLAKSSACGVLEVRDSEEYGFVYFLGGRVEAISLPISDAKLGTRLLRAGCLSELELTDALREDSALSHEERRLKPLGQRLVELGLTSEAILREVLHRQTSDQVFELAQWQRGVFLYDETKAMPQFRIMIQADVQQLLLAAQRRIDEGERALKAVPAKAGGAACFGCPLAPRCTPEIKAKYLRPHTCLWRGLPAIKGDHWNMHLDPGPHLFGDDRYDPFFDEHYDPDEDRPLALRDKRKQQEHPGLLFDAPL